MYLHRHHTKRTPLQPWYTRGDTYNPASVEFKRVSCINHTVRYELCRADGTKEYGPVFDATPREWERAVD